MFTLGLNKRTFKLSVTAEIKKGGKKYEHHYSTLSHNILFLIRRWLSSNATFRPAKSRSSSIWWWYSRTSHKLDASLSTRRRRRFSINAKVSSMSINIETLDMSSELSRKLIHNQKDQVNHVHTKKRTWYWVPIYVSYGINNESPQRVDRTVVRRLKPTTDVVERIKPCETDARWGSRHCFVNKHFSFL